MMSMSIGLDSNTNRPTYVPVSPQQPIVQPVIGVNKFGNSMFQRLNVKTTGGGGCGCGK